MAYALKPDRSIAREARRILRKQAEAALVDLAPRDEAVHTARKRFKKIRAALRLWRGAVRPRDYRRENLAFRDAGRPLTELRDAVVLQETLEKLVADYPSEAPADEVDRARRLLTDRAAATRHRVIDEQQALGHVGDAVRQALERLDHVKVHGKGWQALAGGLQRVYRAGRQSFAVAQAQPTVEHLHEWRKQTKYLRHALELLHACNPVIMDRLAEHAHQLGDLLGQDHDLAVLHETLAGAIEADHLLALMQRRRAELQQAARSMGRRVYADKPTAYVTKIGRRFLRWRRARCALG